MSTCPFDPSTLAGLPIGQMHCPSCGCMVLAGLAHGPCDEDCPCCDDQDRAAWAMAPGPTEE